MEIEFALHKDPKQVIGYLADMQLFATIHPLIYKVEDRGDGSCRVYERFPLKLLPIPFTYPARVEVDYGKSRVVMNARVFGLTDIEIVFVVKHHNEGTIVSESVTFDTPLPISGILERVFRKYHTQLFRNIDKHLQSSESGS